MSEEVGDLHDKISEELWFSDDIIDRHTLYFPATMERIFTREHIGSEDSQLILRNVLCVGLVYYAISEAVSTTTFLREKNTSNSIPSYVLQAFIFIVTEVVGFWNLKHCILNSERWRRLHLRESANYVPVPQGIAYLNLFVYAFRNENYCYMEEFMTWQVSSIGFIYVLSAAIMGLAFKFLPAVFMSAAIFSMVAWRCVVLFAAEASPDYWVRSLSFIMPAFVAFIVNHWAMYVIEYSFRKRFITKKRLEIEMRRLQERHKGVEGILELILPTDVIGRLQASNYNFSAVVDRFETAFSIFIEFISKKELDSMKPEEALRCLNVFFKGLDSILQDFPEVEKIKTISSKALLISCPKGDEEVKRHGDAITKLCLKAIERSLQMRRNISVGIAFGEIVAGIVGVQRFCYDVYGDVVNTSSRMQTLGIRQFALCTGEAYRQFSKDTQTQWRSAGVHFVKGKGMMEVYSVSSPNNRRNTGIDLSSSAETMRSLPSFLDLETNGALEPFDRPIENEGMFALNGSLPITSTTDIDVGDAAVRAVLTAFNPANGVFGSRRNRITPVSDTISATNLSKASVSLTDFLEVFDTTKPVTKAFSQKREKEKSVSSMTIEADKTVWPRRTSMTPPGWHRRTSMNPTWFKVPGFGIVKDVKKRKEGEKNASYAVMMAEPTMTKAAGFETLIEEFSDPWKHIGWLSLVFTDPDIWKRYRRYLRKDEEHRLRTLLLEGVSATLISSITIIVASLYLRYVNHDRPSDLIKARTGKVARQGLFESSSTVGMWVSISFFFVQMVISWLHYGIIRHAVSLHRHKGKVTPLGKRKYITGTKFLNGWALHFIKIVTALGVQIGVQVTPYGQIWLSQQAVVCLFLSYAANIEYDFLEPGMPFYAVAATIVVLTMIPNIAFFMCGMSTIQDMMRIVWMITIVLGGKYRHALARRGNFLLHITLMKSRELQDLESEFIFQLLGAILPARAIDYMLINSNPAGKSYLESFECVTVIHMDVTSFTVLSSMMRPEDVIALLNILFTQFDEICNSHDVEKILTIGDAYVAMRIPQSNTIKMSETIPGTRNLHPIKSMIPSNKTPNHLSTDLFNLKPTFTAALDEATKFETCPPEYHRRENLLNIPKMPWSGTTGTGGRRKSASDIMVPTAQKTGHEEGGESSAQSSDEDSDGKVNRRTSLGLGSSKPTSSSRVFPTSQGGEALGKSVRAPAMAGKGDVRIGPIVEAAGEACRAALEMQEAVRNLVMSWRDLGARGRVDFPFVAQLAGREDGKEALDLLMKLKVRIGVHSGTAFGCLTGGTTKIKYEVVGEAMDVAETMEQRATPGTVRVSRTTMNLIVQRRGPPHLNIFSTDNAPLGDPMEDEDGTVTEAPPEQGLAFVTRRSSDGWVSFELRTRREETAKRQPTSEVVGRSESIYRKERDAVREGKVMMQRVCFEDPN